MVSRTIIVCLCLGILYGTEGDLPVLPDSHLSFIFKEKQNESLVARPKWDFLSELTEENREFLSLFSLGGLAGATGGGSPDGFPPLSSLTPNTAASIQTAFGASSVQNAFGVITFLQSHQNVLATIFNPEINGSASNERKMAFGKEEFDESPLIAQTNFEGGKRRRTPSGTARVLAQGEDNNDVWADFFMNKLKIPSTSGSNDISNTCLGFLLGYDRFISSGMMTGVIGYDHSSIRVTGQVGHGHQNQIFGAFQGIVYMPERMYLGYSLFGSVNLNDFKRNVNIGTVNEVAKSSFTAYTLSPHVDFGYDWCVNDWFIIEPFVSNNFFFNFQPSYSEYGAPGYNEQQDSLNSGFYLVEPGVNLYQSWRREWGMVILREEIGYERTQSMFGTENTVSFVGAQEGITLTTGLRDLNLFVFGFQIFARAVQGFYGDALYRGEWGSGQISNTLHLKVGYFF